MKYLIDTSSLHILARYLIPYDVDLVLTNKLESMFQGDIIILMASVKQECKLVSGGEIIVAMNFLKLLKDRKFNVVDITEKQHRNIDNNWRNRKKLGLSVDEYELGKDSYLVAADGQLILEAIAMKKLGESVAIVTEESKVPDEKPFRKIPLICRPEQLPCINLTKMLQNLHLRVEYSWPEDGF